MERRNERTTEGRALIPTQAVEAAAKAAGLVFDEPANARDIEYIRTILGAAAPHMQAAAWEAGEEAGRDNAFYNLGHNIEYQYNPYRGAK